MDQYQAYLFDWDGTLARTLENWLAILRNQAQTYGLTVSDAEITAHFGQWDWALEFGLDPSLLDTFINEVATAAKAQNPLAPLYDDAGEVLRILKARGKKLALITSSRRASMVAALRYHQIAQMFDVVITFEDIAHDKPRPESIQLALKTLHTPKQQALMLGDSDKDLLAAKNAGVDSLLFYPPVHRAFYDRAYLESIHPRYTINSWQEFLQQVQ